MKNLINFIRFFQNFIEIDKNGPEEEAKTKITKSRFSDLWRFFKFFFTPHQILTLLKNFKEVENTRFRFSIILARKEIVT